MKLLIPVASGLEQITKRQLLTQVAIQALGEQMDVLPYFTKKKLSLTLMIQKTSYQQLK